MTEDTSIKKISLPLLLEFSGNLPAAPRVYARLSKMVENENTALDYIASLIKMDTAMAAHLLRITNSAYQGGSVKINDLQAAINRIGFKEVHKLLSYVVHHECFYHELPLYGMSANAFSHESISAAAAAEIVAGIVGSDPNTAYISGLFKSIGKLSLNLYMEKQRLELNIVPLQEGRSLIETETQLLGINHLRAASELLKHWHFENTIWLPIKNLAYPQQAVSLVKETAILVIASWIPEEMLDFDAEKDLPPDVEWALHELKIERNSLPQLLDNVRFSISQRKDSLVMLM